MTVVIDTNLLLLYLVGSTQLSFVNRHKRLAEYREDDFYLLENHIGASKVLLTPNTLSEVSNLLVYGVTGPFRETLRLALMTLTTEKSEIYVPSVRASKDPFFAELGLTDCVLLDACASGAQLLTVDVKLYVAAARRGIDAVNFNHLRDSTF